VISHPGQCADKADAKRFISMLRAHSWYESAVNCFGNVNTHNSHAYMLSLFLHPSLPPSLFSWVYLFMVALILFVLYFFFYFLIFLLLVRRAMMALGFLLFMVVLMLFVLYSLPSLSEVER